MNKINTTTIRTTIQIATFLLFISLLVMVAVDVQALQYDPAGSVEGPNGDGECTETHEELKFPYNTGPGGVETSYLTLCVFSPPPNPIISDPGSTNPIIGDPGECNNEKGKTLIAEKGCRYTVTRRAGLNSPCHSGYRPINASLLASDEATQQLGQLLCTINKYHIFWYEEVKHVGSKRAGTTNPHCPYPYSGGYVERVSNPGTTGVNNEYYCIHQDSDLRGGDDGCDLGETKVANSEEGNDGCVVTFQLIPAEGYNKKTVAGIILYVLDPGDDLWRSTAGGSSTCTASDDCTLLNRLNDILNVMAFLVIPISSIVIVVGGIQYATAGGNPDALKGARGRIFNGALALVCFLLMWSFLKWLIPGGQLQ